MTSEGEGEKAFEAIAEAYNDAHHFWHQCADNYHEPAAFRTNLNALIQAARNVTFRAQSYKGAIPDFDRWYKPWTTYYASVPVMRWMKDARTEVTKRKGLAAHSRARFRVIWSYWEPAQAKEIDVDPTIPTAVVITRALASIPSQHRATSLVEVTREWQFDDLPGREVLGATREALRNLAAMLTELLKQLQGEPGSPPFIAAANEALPECMTDIDAVTTVRLQPETLASYEHVEHEVRVTNEMIDTAVTRYGLGKPDPAFRLDGTADVDVFALGELNLKLAKTVMARDKYHIPMLFLRGPEGKWTMRALKLDDRLDKFIMWHQMADEVRANRFDAFMLISDNWFAPMPTEPMTEVPDVSKMSGRREALTVHVEAADGRGRVWSALYKRRFGKIIFEETQVRRPQAIGGFAEPIRRAWVDLGLVATAGDDGDAE